MIDIRLIRENPDLVRENIRKKFQDAKLPLVDEVIELDKANRAAINEASNLRAERNALSKKIGMLMGQAKKDPSKLEEAEAVKAQVTAQAARLAELEKQEEELEAKIHKIMLTIPQIIDPSVPLGPDDSCNVEVQRFGEAIVPDFPIPYHTEIMERFDGIDLDAARRVSGNGFYYLMGDIARLHEAVLAYARDFMIGKGFTYCIPPFMIHGNVVEGVMSQTDMDAMMYKIEGEDLYLIGTSEHSMIGRYIDQILTEDQLPQTMTSYSPCFRKEKGAHGNVHPARRERDEPVAIHGDVAILAQALGRVGRARLRDTELLRDVDRADVTVFLLHHQHRFQIVFCGSQDLHSGFHQPFRQIASRLAHFNQKCKRCRIFYNFLLTCAVR